VKVQKPKATEDTFDSPISDCELQEILNQLKKRKSPGEDHIHAEFLKPAGKKQKSQYACGLKKSGKQVLCHHFGEKQQKFPY
jgi:hypothetical protein